MSFGERFAGLFQMEWRLMRAHVPKAARIGVSRGKLRMGWSVGHGVVPGGPRGEMVASSFICAPQCGQRGTGDSGSIIKGQAFYKEAACPSPGFSASF
jgi:hypothetical protein